MAQIDEHIAAHDNDPDAHDLRARLQLLQDQIDAQSRRAWLLAATDNFDRVNGPIAGFTLTTGQTWRNGLGTTTGVISNKRFASSSGNAVALIDTPGIETGRSQVSFSPIVGTGDAWVYVALRESSSISIAVQRGSDRVRLGILNGTTLSFLAEKLGFQTAGEKVSVVVDMTNRTARVDLNGQPAIPATSLPALQYGVSVGIRVGGTSTIDNLTVYQEILL